MVGCGGAPVNRDPRLLAGAIEDGADAMGLLLGIFLAVFILPLLYIARIFFRESA